MKSLRQVWFIALKDLKLFTIDRTALFLFIVFPFMFVILFNFLLADVGGEDTRLALHVVTQEAESGISYQIIEAMQTTDDTPLDPGQPAIIWLRDYDEARRQVENKELSGFLAFPGDFTQRMLKGERTHLEVVVDAEDIYAQGALYGLANAIASQIGSQYTATHATLALLGEQEQITWQPPPGEDGIPTQGTLIQFETQKVGEVEPEQPSNFVIPGYLVMFVFFAAALSAEAIVRERQNHTLERLLSGSVRKEGILAGIFTGAAAKGLLQIAIFWTVGLLVFKIDLGSSPLAVIILSILMVIMSAAFALMLATLVKTERSAGALASLTALVLAPLGGCWWPLFILPEWMQTLAKISPHGWAMTGFNKLMIYGADFSAVTLEMLALVGFAILFGAIAIWRFRTNAV